MHGTCQAAYWRAGQKSPQNVLSISFLVEAINAADVAKLVAADANAQQAAGLEKAASRDQERPAVETIDARPRAYQQHRGQSDQGVRLAQKMQVGPCMPVGIQL